MSAQVIMLFDRGVTARASNTRAEILSRVRTVAIGAGCNGAQKAIVVGAADLWIDQGIRAEDVIKRARAKAEQLVDHSNGPDGPRAA